MQTHSKWNNVFLEIRMYVAKVQLEENQGTNKPNIQDSGYLRQERKGKGKE